jgi:hypothetical protein
VSSATPKEITAGGVVDVPKRRVTEIQQAANKAWIDYLKGVAIGVHPDGVVRVTELIQALMDAGARDVQAPTLNGGSGNVVLAQHEVAVPAPNTSLLTSLTWRPV